MWWLAYKQNLLHLLFLLWETAPINSNRFLCLLYSGTSHTHREERLFEGKKSGNVVKTKSNLGPIRLSSLVFDSSHDERVGWGALLRAEVGDSSDVGQKEPRLLYCLIRNSAIISPVFRPDSSSENLFWIICTHGPVPQLTSHLMDIRVNGIISEI